MPEDDAASGAVGPMLSMGLPGHDIAAERAVMREEYKEELKEREAQAQTVKDRLVNLPQHLKTKLENEIDQAISSKSIMTIDQALRDANVALQDASEKGLKEIQAGARFVVEAVTDLTTFGWLTGELPQLAKDSGKGMVLGSRDYNS